MGFLVPVGTAKKKNRLLSCCSFFFPIQKSILKFCRSFSDKNRSKKMIKFWPAGICLGLMILSGSYYVVSQHISGKASLSESIGTLDGWFFPYIESGSQVRRCGLEIHPGTMRKNKVKPIHRRVQWFWGLIIFWGERVDVFLGHMRVQTCSNWKESTGRPGKIMSSFFFLLEGGQFFVGCSLWFVRKKYCQRYQMVSITLSLLYHANR